MKDYHRRAEDLSNHVAAAGKPNKDPSARIEKYRGYRWFAQHVHKRFGAPLKLIIL
jgi:hypothetical protein